LIPMTGASDPQHRMATLGFRFRLRRPAKYARCSQRCVDPNCRLSMSLVSCGICKIGLLTTLARPPGMPLANSLEI
jgi:hypothetical protein